MSRRKKESTAPPSLMAAAIGLTNLGTPESPPGTALEVAAPPVEQTAQCTYAKPPLAALRPATTVAYLQPRRGPALMMRPHPTVQPTPHDPTRMGTYHVTGSSHAVPRPTDRETSLPLSVPGPYMPPPTGFGAMPTVTSHPSTVHFSSAAMDRFSMAGRVQARVGPTPYGSYYPPYPGSHVMMHPALPTPHQTMPMPSSKNFPETLFDVVSMDEHAHIVSWLPHGRGFIIHDKQRFASYILPHYFDSAKYTSFTRRLKRWKFTRVPRGPELGAYYNDSFVRDKPGLVQDMRYRVEGQADEAKAKAKSGDHADESSDGEKKAEKPPNEKKVSKGGGQDARPKAEEKVSPKCEKQVKSSSTAPSAAVNPENSTSSPSPIVSHRGAAQRGAGHYATGATTDARNGNLRPRGLSDPALGVAGGVSHRPSMACMHRGQPYYTTPTHSQGMIDVRRPRLLSESQLPLGRSASYSDQYYARDASAAHGRVVNVAAQHAGYAPPFAIFSEQPGVLPERRSAAPPAVHTQGRAGEVGHISGGRPVLMSQREEQEFAEFLAMKRENPAPRQWP